MFYRLMESYRRFMAGRYGMDTVGVCLLALYFIANLLLRFILNLLLRSGIAPALWMDLLQLLPYLIFVWAVWRMLSRNVSARYAENIKFTQFWSRLRQFFSRTKPSAPKRKAGAKARETHKIFSCPSCGQQARVPIGKGKISIKCPKCGHEYIQST